MNQENVAIMKELKERLQRKFSFISKVILFGSQTTGQAVEFSDYDILIIVSRPITELLKLKKELKDSNNVKKNYLLNEQNLPGTPLRAVLK